MNEFSKNKLNSMNAFIPNVIKIIYHSSVLRRSAMFNKNDKIKHSLNTQQLDIGIPLSDLVPKFNIIANYLYFHPWDLFFTESKVSFLTVFLFKISDKVPIVYYIQ